MASSNLVTQVMAKAGRPVLAVITTAMVEAGFKAQIDANTNFTHAALRHSLEVVNALVRFAPAVPAALPPPVGTLLGGTASFNSSHNASLAQATANIRHRASALSKLTHSTTTHEADEKSLYEKHNSISKPKTRLALATRALNTSNHHRDHALSLHN